MNSNETRKTKQSNNKVVILEKLMEAIMGEEVDGKDIKDFSRNVDNSDDLLDWSEE